VIEQGDTAGCLGGANEQVEPCVLLQRPRCGLDQSQMYVEQVGRAQLARQHEHVAARDVVVRDTGQIDGHARTRQGDLLFVLVGL
jgi:hypothetical protein